MQIRTASLWPDDGALWFCELSGKKLGRINPMGGSITEYTPAETDVEPRRLVAVRRDLFHRFKGRAPGAPHAFRQAIQILGRARRESFRAIRDCGGFLRQDLDMRRARRRQQAGSVRPGGRSVQNLPHARAEFVRSAIWRAMRRAGCGCPFRWPIKSPSSNKFLPVNLSRRTI